jgi:hypothetical protein
MQEVKLAKQSRIIPAGGSTGTFLNLRKRITRIQKSVSLENKRILDCGCGLGSYLIEFLQLGYDAYGLEYDEGKVIPFGRIILYTKIEFIKVTWKIFNFLITHTI